MSETMEQIAERIARDHIGTASYYDAARSLLKDDVLSALRNERERCARLLNARVTELSNYQTRPYRVARRELEVAAQAIREGK